MLNRRPLALVFVALFMGFLGSGVLVGTAWQVAHGALWPLIVMPPNLAFCYWIGAGAWGQTSDPGQQSL